MTDEQLLDALKEIDEDPDVDMSDNDWECEFMSSMLAKRPYLPHVRLTAAQRKKCEEIVERYGE